MLDYKKWFELGSATRSGPILLYRSDAAFSESPDLVTAETVPLPFEDFHFELALSSDDLFGGDTSVPSIMTVLRELIRVAKEVRLVPHVLAKKQVSEKLGPVILALQQENVGVEVKPLKNSVNGEQAVMLRLWAQQCQLT